jgi:putative DNA primase/helicase
VLHLIDTQDTALAFGAAGVSVVPVRLDGTKTPLGSWKRWQTQCPDQDQIRQWFGDGHPALGVICGTVSGNLEMFELEGRAVAEGLLPALAELLADHGLDDLWSRVTAGYLEQTPSGGLHALYRVDGPATGNTKLARRPATAAELAADPHQKVKVLIETRGEGGFVVVAPTPGDAHPTGRPWALLAGGPESIVTITADERDQLFAIARMLDQMPAPEPAPDPVPHLRVAGPGGPTNPGEDFNERADWADILTPHGWRPFSRRGDVVHWTRPGKGNGTSATTGYGDRGDYLYVFSSSVADLPTEQALSKFAAYAHLDHGGDFAAAARELRGLGYGGEPPARADPAAEQRAAFAELLGVDGTAALDRVIAEETRPAGGAQTIPLATLTDDGNALALVEHHGDKIRYCDDRGRWLHWTGQRWEWCGRSGGVVREYAKALARALPENDREQAAHKHRSLSAAGTTATLTQAASDGRVAVNFTELDADPWILNTPGGIVDLKTGRLGPSDPAKLCTRITACAPDPNADTTLWNTFLTDTFGDDEQLITYLRTVVGYSATGVTGWHIFPFLFGSGGNGKGVFLESLIKVLGDYATTAPNQFLMSSPFPRHLTEIARLAGARMVICSEVNEDDRFDEAKVKQLTGGDTLTANFMRQDPITFTPSHHLWLMGNHQPKVRSGGHSFWRRIRLIPFTRTVPEDKRVDDLQGILARDHGPALLHWIVQGAAAYAAGGIQEPDSVKAATGDYAHDQDTVARFVEDRCQLVDKSAREKVSDVRRAYERWCFEEGEMAVTAKTFGTLLSTRYGIDAVKGTKGQRYYPGLMLLVDDEDAPPDGTSERYR